jgi:hypothetical protein
MYFTVKYKYYEYITRLSHQFFMKMFNRLLNSVLLCKGPVLQFLHMLFVGPFWGLFISYYCNRLLYGLSVCRLRMNPMVPVAGSSLEVFRQAPGRWEPEPGFQSHSAPLIGPREKLLSLQDQISESAPLNGDMNDTRFILWRDYRYSFPSSMGTSSHENGYHFNFFNSPLYGVSARRALL